MKILVTGAAGFIGSNFIRYMLQHYQNISIVNLDKLTYAGNIDNLADVAADSRYSFVQGDIGDKRVVHELLSAGFDALMHFAAESHVDRSIQEPRLFLDTNVLGTQILLEAAHCYRVERFIQVSTDEVYGSLGPTGRFTEESPLAPNSPYAASKAAADLLGRAYYHTYKLPVIITRCSNNYGPYQFPEKLVSLFITNALEHKPLPVYGDGCHSRDWLYVEDHCRALALVLQDGRPGEIYNIGGDSEKTSLEIARAILHELGRPESLITFVQDRPGHDRRYAIDFGKINRELGWVPTYTFSSGMKATVHWYARNETWWRKVKGGQYLEYYARHYGQL
jgi:dTDP-glucose 4,6-dehydratase